MFRPVSTEMDKMYLGLMEAVLIESHHGGTLSDTGHFFTHVVFESAMHFNFKIVILALPAGK